MPEAKQQNMKFASTILRVYTQDRQNFYSADLNKSVRIKICLAGALPSGSALSAFSSLLGWKTLKECDLSKTKGDVENAIF